MSCREAIEKTFTVRFFLASQYGMCIKFFPCGPGRVVLLRLAGSVEALRVQ